MTTGSTLSAASVFTDAQATLTGTISGSSLSFRIDYLGRTDVYATCTASITGTTMTGSCIDEYTSGPRSWTFSAEKM